MRVTVSMDWMPWKKVSWSPSSKESLLSMTACENWPMVVLASMARVPSRMLLTRMLEAFLAILMLGRLPRVI